MTKAQLINHIARVERIHPHLAGRIVGRALTTIATRVVKGEQVSLRGFGVFHARRQWRRLPGHPAPTSRTIAFRPSRRKLTAAVRSSAQATSEPRPAKTH